MTTTGTGRARVVAVVAMVAIAAAAVLAASSGGPDRPRPGREQASDGRRCVRPRELLRRVWRGYVPGRSGDVLAVERRPHQFGTRHSTPYPYTQDVPLVLYGPGFIRSGIEPTRAVTVADIAPTFAELLGFDRFPPRDGSVLSEALLADDERNGVPRLIATVVWDGGGDNVLERWPRSWPRLHALAQRGTAYTNATVGSSPSITPSIHATIGTGAFPATHGLSDVKLRIGRQIVDAWQGDSPTYLRVKTLADMWDAATGDRSVVGLLARDAWHLGMIGHGAAIPGADRDIAVLDDLEGTEFTTNEALYSLPPYVLGHTGLLRALSMLDVRDGEADGAWLGNPLMPIDGRVRYTPAWSVFQTRQIIAILDNESFGADGIPDLFFTNYKSTDLAGHYWNMAELEVRDALEEQDRQIGVLVAALDRLVGRGKYVLAITADHGMAPYPGRAGGWSIDVREITADIEKRFAENGESGPLVVSNRGYQIMLDQQELERRDLSSSDIARFVRTYALEDNVTASSRSIFEESFRDRARERLYLTALTPPQLRHAISCREKEDTAVR